MPNSTADHAGIIARAWHWLEQHFSPVDELSRLSQLDLQLMSADLGISEQDLQTAASAAHDCTPELTAMMRATGLDPDVVQQRYHTIMRDIQVTCVRCPNRSLCARELAAGRAAATHHAYCGNAETFDELLAETEAPSQTPH